VDKSQAGSARRAAASEPRHDCPANKCDNAVAFLLHCTGLQIGKPAFRQAGSPPLSSGSPPLSYSVKEIFYTLQGEGTHAGRPAVFCRFAGCNLWSGREQDRAAAICRFCDTDFVGTDGELGGKYSTSDELAMRIDSLWPAVHAEAKFVVFTGGEPLLQLNGALLASVHARGFEIAIETNGTLPVPEGVDWICVSPKMGAELRVAGGNELKVVIPQAGQSLETYEALQFEHFYVQPMDGPDLERNTRLAIDICKRNPKWKLSLQTHKLLRIP
jgi:7-carboxy-7-deazaguanine synthase